MKTIKRLLEVVFLLLIIGACKKPPITDPVSISPVNTAPIVKAGEDIILEIPTNSVSLTATTTDVSRIRSYKWKTISGPSSGFIEYDLTVQDGRNVKAIWLEEGIYEFEVTATDLSGLSGKDTVKVTLTTQLQKHVINDLKPNSSMLTEIELPKEVFENLKWVYCRSSAYCERADAGPLGYINYDWGGWYFNMLTDNKISIYGGYGNSPSPDEFDLIVYY
jgi:hypothetical protein